MTLQENITKASIQAADLLAAIRDAHATACEKNQSVSLDRATRYLNLAEMILMDITERAVEINQKLARLANALK